MSHFHGTIEGDSQTAAGRRGTKSSGLTADLKSYTGDLRVILRFDEETQANWYEVWHHPVHDRSYGKHLLVSGKLGVNPHELFRGEQIKQEAA